jgi:hypothetical protein
MSIQILHGHNGRDVYRVVTPSGVVGFIATEIPDEVLALFMRKLKRKIRDGERREARRVLAGSDKRRR